MDAETRTNLLLAHVKSSLGLPQAHAHSTEMPKKASAASLVIDSLKRAGRVPLPPAPKPILSQPAVQEPAPDAEPVPKQAAAEPVEEFVDVPYVPPEPQRATGPDHAIELLADAVDRLNDTLEKERKITVEAKAAPNRSMRIKVLRDGRNLISELVATTITEK